MMQISRATPARAKPPRILVDLAEGRLSDDEVSCVVAWLSADEPRTPPEWLVQASTRTSRTLAVAHR